MLFKNRNPPSVTTNQPARIWCSTGTINAENYFIEQCVKYYSRCQEILADVRKLTNELKIYLKDEIDPDAAVESMQNQAQDPGKLAEYFHIEEKASDS